MALRLDLPDQTDVTGFRCVRVWIPDGDGYESALHSLLTYANRWFAWQRDPDHRGAVAAALWRAAYLQTTADYFAGLTCDDCTPQPDNNGTAEPCPTCGQRGGIIIMEESDMGQVVTNVEKITGGLRVYFGPCCYVDLDLTDLALDPPPDIVFPVEDPPATYYACGKVQMLITYLLALSDALWASYTNPETIEAAARAAVPMATLSRARIYQWIATLISLSSTGMAASHFNVDDANQSAACDAIADVAATATGTGEERGVVVEAMASAYYNTVGLMTKAQWQSYWHTIAETIGDEDCRLILSLGATDDTADCECPDYDPSASWDLSGDDWIMDIYFHNYTTPTGFVLGSANGITVITALYAELQANTAGTDDVLLSFTPNTSIGCTVTKIFATGPFPTGFGSVIGAGLVLDPAGENLEATAEYSVKNEVWKYNKIGLTWAMGNFDISWGGDPNGTTTPLMPGFARLKLAGTGPHPLS